MAKVSDPLRNDLRHHIWNALLRLGHSVPCFEKQRNHSMNNEYCSFKGRVSSACPIASSNAFMSSPFLLLCSHPKSESIGLNHAWRSLNLDSGGQWNLLVPIAINRTAETRLSSYFTIGDAISCNLSSSSWFAHRWTNSSAIWWSSRISRSQFMLSTCFEIRSKRGFSFSFFVDLCPVLVPEVSSRSLVNDFRHDSQAVYMSSLFRSGLSFS